MGGAGDGEPVREASGLLAVVFMSLHLKKCQHLGRVTCALLVSPPPWASLVRRRKFGPGNEIVVYLA